MTTCYGTEFPRGLLRRLVLSFAVTPLSAQVCFGGSPEQCVRFVASKTSTQLAATATAVSVTLYNSESPRIQI